MSDLDDELHIMIPMVCFEDGCSYMYCPGGFGRPFTARKIIASLEKIDWQWIPGDERPTKGKVYCSKHHK